MNKRRLLKLAGLLEKDAKNKKGIKFDLGTWGRIGNSARPVSCGTVGCAIGLAVASGEFRRAGLTADNDHNDPIESLCPRMPSGNRGLTAAAELFDLNLVEAGWLFDTPSYRGRTTGKQGELKVAKRIRDFVAGKAHPQQAGGGE